MPAAEEPQEVTISAADAKVVIGLTAIVESYVCAEALPQHMVDKLAERFLWHGLMPMDGGNGALNRALGQMNQRFRAALGEYDTPGTSPMG